MATVVRAAYWLASSVNDVNAMPLEQIDPSHFTHLFCAFADLDRTSNKVTINRQCLNDFSKFSEVLRSKNPDVKTLLSIGGSGDKVANDFTSMARMPATRAKFIDSSIKLARDLKFDGLDLNCNFPDDKTTKSNLGKLLQEWKEAVDNEGNTPRLLLTATVHFSKTKYVPYTREDMANNLSWINAMACDLGVPPAEPEARKSKTAPSAALYSNNTVSGDDFVTYLVAAGVPKNRIVLAIPFYGYGWTLQDASKTDYGADATGPANSNTGESYWRYKDVKSFVADHGATTEYDQDKVDDRCFHGTTWISYNNEEAVRDKVRFVKNKGLLGYLAWNLAGDDEDFTLSKAAAASV